MLFDERIDAIVATSVVAHLDGVVMVTKMNANLLCCIIILDIEDLSVAPSSIFRRLLANPSYKSTSTWRWSLNAKGLLCKAIQLDIIRKI